MIVYLFTDRTCVLYDDNDASTITFASGPVEDHTGVLQIAGERHKIKEGEPVPHFKSHMYSKGCFKADSGREYQLENVAVVSGGIPHTGMFNVGKTAMDLRLRVDELENLIYDLRREIEEVRTIKGFETMGVFKNKKED